MSMFRNTRKAPAIVCRSLAVFASASVLVVLAGCATVTTPAGEPPAVAITPIPLTLPRAEPVVIDGNEVAWATRGKSIVVTLWGSSCAPQFSSSSAIDDDEVLVTFVDGQGDELCLEYLRQYDTDVLLPASVTGTPLTVSVSLPSSKTISGFVLQ